MVDLLTLCLGVTLTLSFAPYGIFPLAILSLAGLMYLIKPAKVGRAAWLGFVFGLGFFGSGVYWVYISIHQIGMLPVWLSTLITGGMIAILSLYPSAVCYITNRYYPSRAGHYMLFAFPAIWVFLEIARAWLCSGFPWLLAGYSQTNSPLSGYAPIFSVYGVSLAILMSASLLVNGYDSYRKRYYRACYFSLLSIVAIWTVGGLLSLITWTSPESKPVTVSLIQGNIPQSMKWSPEHIKLSLSTYDQLSEPLWGKSDIIIWPEAAIPLTIQDARPYIDAMDKKALTSGTHLILGIPVRATNGEEGYYNTIVTLGSDKKIYAKRHLVPFGEYAPIQQPQLNKFLKFVNIDLPDTIAGEIDQAPITVDKIMIQPFICYEIAFPQLYTSSDRQVGLLLTVTNDAWFGKSAAQAQHLQMAQMRSQETRRPSLFVSNDGITAIIGPTGTIEASAPPHQTAVLTGQVQPMQGMTPWIRNRSAPLVIVLIAMLFYSYQFNRRARKQHNLSKEMSAIFIKPE